MKSVTFCFATHNHQPIGNFDNIIEEAYQHSYLPFFELAAKYPDVRFGTHFTGILLDWLQRNHPEYISRLRGLVQSEQLEIISGGYYEPILSVIPARDQQAQIKKLSETIRSFFGYDPSGMWLAERVWEQPLASVLHEANIRYVLLDDTHFLAAGLAEENLNGYYLTEDKGQTLAVFPISKALRYTIPFSAVDETIRVLRDASSESGENIVCFADDGEKFGVWPRTFDHVYRDGWLEEFFRKLSENKSWISMRHLAEAVREIPPVGRIYLPNASYAEMMQWALPTATANQKYEDFVHKLEEDKEQWEEYMPFVRGGYWRNFFAKYPETNQLHKHMLRTSARFAQAPEANPEAYDRLLASQCNDPYWHGVFGGAYLTNLRHANFSALVEADRLLDISQSRSGISMSQSDFDCDGFDEVIIESDEFAVYVKPSLGGMIAELDYKPANFNVMNTITRAEEAYHKKITKAAEPAHENATKSIHDIIETKEAGLEKLLAYDWYRHGCMIDHVLGESTTPEEFRSMKFEERADFLRSAYEWNWNASDSTLQMSRTGVVWQGGREHEVRITKTLFVIKGALKVTYELANASSEPLRLQFASEWVFNLLAGDAHDRYFEVDGQKLPKPKMNSIGAIPNSRLQLVDEYLKLRIGLDAPSANEIWRVPIESVSLSEAGFERVFQGSIVMPIWQIALDGKAKWRAEMTVSFNPA